MIKYEVTVKQVNTLTFEGIRANSEEEARTIAEENAEHEYADKKKRYAVTSQAFALEDDKVFVTCYRKPRRSKNITNYRVFRREGGKITTPP